MTSVLFIGILVAQVLGTWLWVEQLKSSEKTRVTNISKELGSYIAQAVGFFEKLPSQYREETLSQLRQNGGAFLDFGAEFFVTSNNQYVDLSQITNSEFSIFFRDDLNIRFVKFSDAQTMIPNSPSEGLTNNQILASLSPIWRSLGLVVPNADSPVAIIQFRLKNQNDWMYLASIIPKGELLLSFDWVN